MAHVVRAARSDDVAAICAFGDAHVRAHYTPLIGKRAADDQVRMWWGEDTILTAVAEGLIVIADEDGQVVGVGQRGRHGEDHVVYKLYVHPHRRGRGIGPQLIDALRRQLPPGVDRLFIEHFAGNERASAFYEREGFVVDHIETASGDDRALDTVWRSRTLS